MRRVPDARRRFTVVHVVLSAILFQTAEAGLLRIESRFLSSIRSNGDFETELPMNEFFETHYVSDDRAVAFNTNFSLMGDPLQKTTGYQVYALDAYYEVLPKRLRIRAGRGFGLPSQVRSLTTDSISVDGFFLDQRIRVGASGGVERKTLKTSLASTSRFVGLSGQYRTPSFNPSTWSGKYELRDLNSSDRGRQHWVSGATSHPMMMTWSPEWLGSVRSNVTSRTLGLAETGLDLYPSLDVGIRTRLLAYLAEATDEPEDPIYSIFADGRLYEATILADKRFSRELASSVSVGLTQFPLSVAPTEERAWGSRLLLDVRWKDSFWRISPSLYGFWSYGGWLAGTRVALSQMFSDRNELSESVDYSFYEKITGSRRGAWSVEVLWNHWFWNHFKVGVGGEFNNNNMLSHDLRALTTLTYLYWGEL